MKEVYGNLSGNSGIQAFEIGATEIKVWFKGKRRPYVYNYINPGADNVERMKSLAIEGVGLSTYISQHVGRNYYKIG